MVEKLRKSEKRERQRNIKRNWKERERQEIKGSFSSSPNSQQRNFFSFFPPFLSAILGARKNWGISADLFAERREIYERYAEFPQIFLAPKKAERNRRKKRKKVCCWESERKILLFLSSLSFLLNFPLYFVCLSLSFSFSQFLSHS